MDLPRHRVSLSEPASPVGLVLEPELAWAWGPGSIVSSLIGEPIRPVDQEGSLPPAIRTWGFLLPGKPGLSIRPARKPLFEQRDYCSGPLTVNSSRFGELPAVLGTGGSPTAQSWVTGRTMVTSPLESGSAETLQRMLLGRSSGPAFTAIPPVPVIRRCIIRWWRSINYSSDSRYRYCGRPTPSAVHRAAILP